MSALSPPLTIVEGLLPLGSCYDAAYVGTYGVHSLYSPCWDCYSSFTDVQDDTRVQQVTLTSDVEQLVWVTEAALEPELLESHRAKISWSQTEGTLGDALWSEDFMEPTGDNVQEALGSSDRTYPAAGSVSVIHKTKSSYLFAVGRSSIPSMLRAIDESLLPHQRVYTIPYPPTPLIPVPKKDVARVQTLLDGLKYNHTIARLVNVLNVAQMNLDITWLTGEARASSLGSRHSFHPDTLKAANWIKNRIDATGAGCELRSFAVGFAPNIICRYNGTEDTSELVLLSAHYDSRGSFGSPRAPGGDDDGSGTTSILSIARSIGTTGIRFKKNVELCLFAGEEQGLVGSRAYARELRKADADIILMIQADMLAYHKPGEPPQLGLPDPIGTPEVTQLIANVSALYSPELEVGITPACCSDHQSFYEQGFAASQVFERAGPIADPMYHNSGDLSQREGYDFWQLRSIAKVQFATLLHSAGFDI